MKRAFVLPDPGWGGRLDTLKRPGYEPLRPAAPAPWVAVECDEALRFLQGYTDVTGANKTGDRGVLVYFFLDIGHDYLVMAPRELPGRARRGPSMMVPRTVARPPGHDENVERYRIRVDESGAHRLA